MRLVGAVLAERHDEWAEERRYVGLDALAAARRVGELKTPEAVAHPELNRPNRLDPTAGGSPTGYTTAVDLTLWDRGQADGLGACAGA